uniref:Uncharacterized protein LOC114332806 n=1 Tax=Diabrotica virgifera virgifera TaxID=50390 RepID=A0A6P7FZZ1_DIAVI
MKDFDFEDKLDIKVEDIKNIPTSQESKTTTSSPLLQQNNPRMPSYPSMDFTKTELSPAAQTLKQMAEQHQHKNQMGLSFTAARSPYGEFQFQGSDYGSPNSIHKNSPTFPQPDMIKQEMIFQGNEYDMKRKNPGIYKQQYSPYSSPSASNAAENEEGDEENKMSHAEGKTALQLAATYVEQQKEATAIDVMIIKKWHDFAH